MNAATTGAMLLCSTVLAAGVASAQGRDRTLEGVVIDSLDHKPQAQVTIYVGRVSSGERTAKDGTFRVSGPEGPLTLMAHRPGYVPALVTVPPGTTGQATAIDTIRLRPVKTDADRAAVRAIDVRVFPELGEFYARKAKYRGGLFLTPDDMEHQRGPIARLIREKPGFHFICIVNRKKEWDCGQQAERGRTSITNANPRSAEQRECNMTVWSNATDLERPLSEIMADEVLALEAYPNPGATPPSYSGSSCATIMLYMKPKAP